MAVMVMGVGTLVFTQTGQQQTPPVRNYNAAPKSGKKYVATREIIFDKAAGKLRLPTAEETQALADQISSLTSRSSEGLTVGRSARGGRMMSLEGRFAGVVLGRALVDGTTEVRCVTTLEEAVEFLGLEESIPQQ
ncbi:MAG: hypothetical protein ABIS29_17530 [Vicinamibacterales bacterium]